MSSEDLAAQLEQLHAAAFGWALSCCSWDRTTAEDVLQASYLKILDGRARFGGRSSFRTWVFGVIGRTAPEARRRTALGRWLPLARLLLGPAPAHGRRAAASGSGGPAAGWRASPRRSPPRRWPSSSWRGRSRAGSVSPSWTSPRPAGKHRRTSCFGPRAPSSCARCRRSQLEGGFTYEAG